MDCGKVHNDIPVQNPRSTLNVSTIHILAGGSSSRTSVEGPGGDSLLDPGCRP